MKAQEFDKKFDEGKEDIIDDLDLASARRVNQEQKRINVDFPSWVVESLDREAARIGVTRLSIIQYPESLGLAQTSAIHTKKLHLPDRVPPLP